MGDRAIPSLHLDWLKKAGVVGHGTCFQCFEEFLFFPIFLIFASFLSHSRER